MPSRAGNGRHNGRERQMLRRWAFKAVVGMGMGLLTGCVSLIKQPGTEQAEAAKTQPAEGDKVTLHPDDRGVMIPPEAVRTASSVQPKPSADLVRIKEKSAEDDTPSYLLDPRS